MRRNIEKLMFAVCLCMAPNLALASEFLPHMAVKSGTASTPVGHYEYCKRFSGDCKITSRNITPVTLTRKKWKELVEINGYSNDAIRPVTDMDLYKTEELWAYPADAGDCEDYVLMKRHMLMQKGWPAASLLITVARRKDGEGHAVLTVRTDRGDYILDNLNDKILRWDKVSHVLLKRQKPSHSGRWQDISYDLSRKLYSSAN